MPLHALPALERRRELVDVDVEGTNFEVTAGQELIKHYTQEGFTGVGFCSNCGSSLYAFGDGKYYVSAGTLQDLELRPQYHMMVAYKAPWDEIGDDAPQTPGVPARGLANFLIENANAGAGSGKPQRRSPWHTPVFGNLTRGKWLVALA